MSMPQNSVDHSTSRTGTILGRYAEMQAILSHIRDRKSFHLYGPERSGKSTLLGWAYAQWEEIDNSLVPIYCRSSRTLREILLHLSGFLLNHFKNLTSVDKFRNVSEIATLADIRKLNIRALKKIIYAYITRDNFCVILDHLEYVTPRINSLLTVLYEKALVITASRQSWVVDDYTFWGNLEYRLYLTPKLRIENLSKQDAFLLMKNIAGDALEADRVPFEDIYRITKGNAGMIKEILTKALMPRYCFSGRINLDLVMLDLKIDRCNKRL